MGEHRWVSRVQPSAPPDFVAAWREVPLLHRLLFLAGEQPADLVGERGLACEQQEAAWTRPAGINGLGCILDLETWTHSDKPAAVNALNLSNPESQTSQSPQA